MAEQMADRFNDDGECFEDANGTNLSTACRDAGAVSEHPGDDVHRYTFPDDSAIIAAGGVWDIGYVDCFCWQGMGHDDDCDNQDE
jgi:hypothetical protein